MNSTLNQVIKDLDPKSVVKVGPKLANATMQSKSMRKRSEFLTKSIYEMSNDEARNHVKKNMDTLILELNQVKPPLQPLTLEPESQTQLNRMKTTLDNVIRELDPK